jgi:archaemetzincin
VNDEATETVALVPIDLDDSVDLERLGRDVGRTWRLAPRVLHHAVDLHAALDPIRGQYEARRLLTLLAQLPGKNFVLGVTRVDLYLPVLTFVIGEAHLDGRAAVVSTFRLAEERYGRESRPDLSSERLLKEAVHELGHCRGLVHCRNPECVMYTSVVAEDVDLKGAEPCRACRAKLGLR